MTVTKNAVSLKAKNIYKRYGQRDVVHDITISICRGEIVGILGPNGAGKTTTFYMLVGLVDPDQGRILIDDTDITNLPIHKRARQGIAYLPQEASVFRNLTVYENIMAILQLRKDLNRLERKEKCQSLLEEFHLDHLSNSSGISLSGGERRRVEIARALANDPAFLLLDEPFAGVDPISVIDLKKIIRVLKSKNIGILITDHNVRETLDISERAYIVHAGKIFAEGTPQEILANKEVQRVYLGEDFK